MDDDTILRKTAKGTEEIDTRAHGLGMRARRVLILVDGHRSVAQLANNSADAELRDTLRQLVDAGFVDALPARAPAASPPPASAAAPQAAAAASAEPPAAADESQLCTTLKEYMTIQLRAIVVGWRALDMVGRIDRCTTLEQLRGEVPAWHRMIAKARDGGPHKADQLLASLRQYLAG